MAAIDAGVAPDLEARAPISGFLRFAAVVAVIGSLTFNLFLCFVNTRVTPMSDGHVMLMEMMLTGAAFIVAADRRAGLYIFLTMFVAYMAMLFTLRHQIDLKAIRDIASPAIFFTVGARLRDVRLADRLALAAGLITLFFALFEYFLLEVYLDWFNVLGYYISRGTVTLQESYGATRGLFISGNRPEPRTILPFLGQHRVSSVFLEPVSMGNFGVILFSWGVFRAECRYRYVLIAIALSLVTLADARFGLFTCILIAMLTPFFRFTPKLIWIVAPFLLLSLFAAYGLTAGISDTPNDLSGRFKATANILTNLPPAVVFGAEATDVFTADSGYAYTLTKFGIFGFIGLWTAFVLLPVKNSRAWNFRAMMVVYLLLIMIISNSFYSIKTGGLMWFLTGTAAVVALPERATLIDRLIVWFQRLLRPALAGDAAQPPAR